jgi:hypothetical protein
VKYQQGLVTLEKLDQMRQTTTDFAQITNLLKTMNRRLNMKATVKMARDYDKNMDIMEHKEETMSDLLLERDELDGESIKKADEYIQKAREKAGLDTDSKFSTVSGRIPTEAVASGSGVHTRSSAPIPLSSEDEDLIRKVNNL